MSFTGTAEYCAFYSAGIFAPTFSKYVLYYHMLSHFMPSLSLFFFNYFRLLRRTHSTDSFPPFRSMCSYKFYLQINVHKVGIKATVNVQNKTTTRSILSYIVSSFSRALALVTSSSSRYCALRWFEANAVAYTSFSSHHGWLEAV